MRSVAEMTPRASSRLKAWQHLRTLSYAGSGKPAAERPQKGGRLLIRVPQMEGEQWEKLQLLFSIFEGETPLLVRAADTGRLLKAGEEYNTDANPVLLGELRRVLGQENVALLPPEAPKAPPEPALQ